MPDPSIQDVPKELRATVADAVARGWSLDRRKGAGHFRLVHPDHRAIPVACSSGDRFLARHKLKSQLRRAERGL